MLGTTKPPYTLALLAALLRDAGCEVRLVDATAERLSIDDVIARLDRDGLRADADRLPDHDADARRRRGGDGAAQAALRRADVLLRSARVDRCRPRRWRARRKSTACSSASPRTASSRSRSCESVDRLGEIAEPDVARARRGGAVVPHRAHGTLQRASWACRTRRGTWSRSIGYSLPLVEQAVRHRRDEPRLPVHVRLLRRADPSGPQVPRAQREVARRRDRARPPRARRSSSSTCGATPSR